MVDEKERIKEELVILRCQLGDIDAFRELIELMEDRLFHYIRHFLYSEEYVYDVLQEVWLTVFQKLRRLRETKSFRAWIYRIAHDKAINQMRKEMNKEKFEEDFREKLSLQEDEKEFIDPSLDMEKAENISQINKWLEKLSPSHREVLILYFIEEMKYEEIAKVLVCHVGTVKSRIHYAKNALRHLMESGDNGIR